ncbi:uncharacterized protein [Equus asinus]|uniref:uncharacterized protein isoform X2 n=1 Tax=Equus asinus TaxID=9793 RepID=UPI0038F76C86
MAAVPFPGVRRHQMRETPTPGEPREGLPPLGRVSYGPDRSGKRQRSASPREIRGFPWSSSHPSLPGCRRWRAPPSTARGKRRQACTDNNPDRGGCGPGGGPRELCSPGHTGRKLFLITAASPFSASAV